MNTNEKINGGAFQIARKMFQSELWNWKPSSWKVIWIYILGNVNHQERNGFQRGEGYFNFTRELENLGNDITPDMIKKFLGYARKSSMIDTKRSTRGMRIKVLNYNTYQTIDNYQSTDRSTREAREKHERSTPIHKNDKNDKNDKNVKKDTIPSKTSVLQGSQWNELIDSFKEVNPMYTDFYKNITERKALEDMADRWGYEKLLSSIRELPKIIGQPYAPKITSPTELRRGIGKLVAFYNQEKNKITNKKSRVLI